MHCADSNTRLDSRKEEQNVSIYALLHWGRAVGNACPAVHAMTFTFNTDPFAGTNVLNAPGRQIVGGEAFMSFSIANDVFALDSTALGVRPPSNSRTVW